MNKTLIVCSLILILVILIALLPNEYRDCLPGCMPDTKPIPSNISIRAHANDKEAQLQFV